MRYLAFITCQVLLLVAITAMGMSKPAHAQPADGFVGWTGVGVDTPQPTAYEACKAMWLHFGGRYPSRFIGAFPHADNATAAECDWTRYQWLCPAETGAGLGCGTIIPVGVNLVCASGYTATADGHCRRDPPVEQPCDCDKPGRANPKTPNPIVLSTGAKVLTAEDYVSADGQLRIGRSYRSFQVGMPIDGTRLPRSQPRGLIGGWNFDFGPEIQLGAFSGSPASPTAKVAVLLPDGTGYGFVLQASGAWIPDPSFGAANVPNDLKLEYIGTLPSNLADVPQSTNSWKLTDRDDNVWTFETRLGPNGGSHITAYPTQKVARGGYTWNFAYNADSSLDTITDSFGRTATFTWDQYYLTTLSTPPSGAAPYPLAIRSIALPDGTALRYTYDPPAATSAPSTSMIKRLAMVERLSAASAVLGSVTYLYEDTRFPTHVTGIVDNRAVRIRTYAYDTKGRGVASQGADGAEAYAVEYGTSGTSLTRRVTNPLGKAENYTFAEFSDGPEDYRLTQVAGEASANTPPSTKTISYGSDTFIDAGTDQESRDTATTRDARGRPTTIVEADGLPAERTTTITYNLTYNVPATVVRNGLTETYTYNGSGQLTSVTQTDTTSHSVPYSTNGQTRTTAYTWNAAGQLLTVNGPLAAVGSDDDLTSYTYDTDGDLLTITDAAGHVTTFSGHDANGRPGTMTDANGIVTAFTYDGLGRTETITVEHPSNSAFNAVTTMAYDAVGNVTSITLPSTDAMIMDYDNAGRVSSVRAASGERRDYTYDAAGNVTSETVKRSNSTVARQITRTFDELGRVLRESQGPRRTVQFAYDKVGNVTSTTSPRGHATTAAFDGLDRLINTVAPDTGGTTLAYDERDNLTSHEDPISVTTTFVYNGFGDVIQEASPDRGTSTYSYDAAGRLIQSTDGRGQVVDYTRDFLGRVTSKVPQGHSGEAVTYYWDTGGLSGSYEVGRLAKIVDVSGTTKFKYDHRGNLLIKEQAIGSSSTAQLAYTYDLADRITQISYPSGRLVKYDYDSKGRVSGVSTKANSGVGSWTTISSNYAYEAFGPVKSMTLGNGLAVTNDWGNDGRLAARRLYKTSNNADVSYLTYRYDADDNIVAINDQVTPANSVLYGYDDTGRMSVAVIDSATTGTETYSYTSGKNRLASVTNASGTRSISYDGRGNTDTETRPGSIAVATGYDGYARLTGYTKTGGTSLAFGYNGLDDRVVMTIGSDTRRLLYAADGRVLGEYGSDATDVRAEFIWASPAVGSSSSFGGDDSVGGYAPLAVTTPDLLGAAQLNWVHGNHLGVPLAITDVGGDPAATPNDYFAPGFPGQSRVLADLYYNRYRDYDPATGRYIQADPIGLAGSNNPYLYANADPLNMADPLGLQVSIPAQNGNGPMSVPASGVPWRPQPSGPLCAMWNPSKDWCGSKGTEWVPDGNWSEACWVHDNCYGDSGASKLKCDFQIWQDINGVCRKRGGNGVACSGVGFGYFFGLTAGGWPAYNDAQRQRRGR